MSAPPPFSLHEYASVARDLTVRKIYLTASKNEGYYFILAE